MTVIEEGRPHCKARSGRLLSLQSTTRTGNLDAIHLDNNVADLEGRLTGRTARQHGYHDVPLLLHRNLQTHPAPLWLGTSPLSPQTVP